jgi:hypothetical protein
MPGAVVLKQLLFDTIGVVALGVLTAWLNGNLATTSSPPRASHLFEQGD